MQVRQGARARTGAGWALVMSGVLYAAFHAGAFLMTDDGDDLWWLGLVVHGVLVVCLMIGLIGARRRFDLEGWAGTTWTVSTVLAFLGVTVSHVFWSVAMVGIAAVTSLVLRRSAVAAAITLGAIGWLGVYAIGVRIGDANGRLITSGERGVAALSLLLMGAGLVGLGITSLRRPQPYV